MSSLDPQKMAQVQGTSSKINAEVRIIYPTNEINMKFTPVTPEAEAFLKNFLPQFAETMANQLSAFFSIKGEIIDVGKKP